MSLYAKMISVDNKNSKGIVICEPRKCLYNKSWVDEGWENQWETRRASPLLPTLIGRRFPFPFRTHPLIFFFAKRSRTLRLPAKAAELNGNKHGRVVPGYPTNGMLTRITPALHPNCISFVPQVVVFRRYNSKACPSTGRPTNKWTLLDSAFRGLCGMSTNLEYE